MGRIVMVAYRPKPGREHALRHLLSEHHARLLAENLVTTRAPVLMLAADGTIIEIFEWRSAEAIARAHENASVQQMWVEFAAVCDYRPVGETAEAGQLFSEFAALN